MAERSREQWLRAVRRWTVVGAVAGLGTAAYVLLREDDGIEGLLPALAYVLGFVLMGASFGLMLWASTYRYSFGAVWGWRATALTFGLMALLTGGGIGVLCSLGGCGDG